jgi:hypothetical protein
MVFLKQAAQPLQVFDQDTAPTGISSSKYRIQYLARMTDKWPAQPLFHASGRLAHQHDPSIGRASPRNSLYPPFMERTAGADAYPSGDVSKARHSSRRRLYIHGSIFLLKDHSVIMFRLWGWIHRGVFLFLYGDITDTFAAIALFEKRFQHGGRQPLIGFRTHVSGEYAQIHIGLDHFFALVHSATPFLRQKIV